ncbi:MAG: lipoyl(octanoyl) transferase LipB [Hyphomicrobiales bacterium]
MTRSAAPGAIPAYDLGRVPYRAALAFQRRAVAVRARGEAPDVLYFAEHDPVVTIGRDGHLENLRAAPAAFARRGVDVVAVERDGDAAYLGPGQVVGMPIVSLDGLPGGRDLPRYRRDLEEAILRAVASYGLRAARRSSAPGVWVGGTKIAATGVAVRHGVAFHGFTLHVDPDPSHLALIHPCGLRLPGDASLASLLGTAPPRVDVIARLAESFAGVWGRPVLLPNEEPAHA